MSHLRDKPLKVIQENLEVDAECVVCPPMPADELVASCDEVPELNVLFQGTFCTGCAEMLVPDLDSREGIKRTKTHISTIHQRALRMEKLARLERKYYKDKPIETSAYELK